jgi:tRNA-dihydrouridine synthase
MGYDGIDLNFGCPDKNVVRNGACSAFILPENRAAALEIIQATKAGAGTLPVSVKTRLGFDKVDLSWHELLLQQDIRALTIHGRTKKQMSKVPADWDVIADIRARRDKLAPHTRIIGNGDVESRTQGLALAEKHQLDGIMIGRGVFHDPFVFADSSPWDGYSKLQRIELYRRHVELFAATWQPGERKIHTLNKFCKIYINGFDGAKELREQLMNAQNIDGLLTTLRNEA